MVDTVMEPCTAPPQSLFTCRYWALGPACPNLNSYGTDVCTFAHWDTGLLASAFEQRGTCRYWIQGHCHKGESCWYEHRDTGVDGLYQGALSLTGFNLEIVNAVKSAHDFNDDRTLFDFIWAIKRVTMKYAEHGFKSPPPKDPVYPDRYRPSGAGDNTKRKRRRPQKTPDVTHSVDFRANIIVASAARQRVRQRHSRRVQQQQHRPSQTTNHRETGTRSDPVNLFSDDEATSGSKRQKLAASPTLVPPLQPDPVMSRVTIRNRLRDVSNVAFTREANLVPSTRPNEPRHNELRKPSPALVDHRNQAADQHVLMENLWIVQRKMANAGRQMQNCSSIMWQAVEEHARMLKTQRTMPVLVELSNTIDLMVKFAEAGIKQAKRVVEDVT